MGIRLFVPNDEMIDRGAQALRERQQGGQGNLVAWNKLPNATKKKWREHVKVILEAASKQPAEISPHA